jgi:hypothetical protein
MHLVLEFLARRHVGHVHAVPSHVELPAVVDAADAAFLVAAQVERGAAMRAAVVEDADASLRVAKGDELLPAASAAWDRRPPATRRRAPRVSSTAA